jgi:hypothetical protein
MSTRTPGLFADSPGARTNRIRSILIRFGIRTFKVKLRQASKHLEELRGPRRRNAAGEYHARVAPGFGEAAAHFVGRSERSRERD